MCSFVALRHPRGAIHWQAIHPPSVGGEDIESGVGVTRTTTKSFTEARQQLVGVAAYPAAPAAPSPDAEEETEGAGVGLARTTTAEFSEARSGLASRLVEEVPGGLAAASLSNVELMDQEMCGRCNPAPATA